VDVTSNIYDLTESPICNPEDLGKPIPDSPHAVSVALPLWEHVIGYEENDPAIVDAMQLGYPRFKKNPFVQKMIDDVTDRFAKEGEVALVFPSEKVAHRCVEFIQSQVDVEGRVEEYGVNGIYVVVVQESAADALDAYWQHSGEIVSSRMAEATLAGKGESSGGNHAKLAIETRISELTGVSAFDVFLFPTGMAALAAIQRAIHRLTPNAKSVQLGFPYVDLMKLQEKIGTGYHFFPNNDASDSEEFKKYISEEPISGVFTDLPGNPLLGSASIPRLANLLRPKGIPLIVDETVGTYYNVDPFPYADIVMTSLTKYFCGVGDVMAGAVLLNPESDNYTKIRQYVQGEYEDLLWGEDAILLAERCKDFETRMARINKTAEKVADFLTNHPKVEIVHFPKYNNRGNYSSVIRERGGFGGMMSIVVKNAEKNAMPFYDNLRVCKGPSLGANYTLACPYTQLAHFDQLDYVESHGVSPYLVRVSVGLEDLSDLISRFEEALNCID
jgi:cystathionine gamma-synthase